MWKPLTDSNQQQNSFRRQQQRAYVDFIGVALNGSTATDNTNTSIAQRSDAILYIQQHLEKVENHLKTSQADGINALHYKDLLLRVKKITERYASAK